MKKKTVFTSAVSLALAGVMCVGFAACGQNGGEGTGTPSEIAQNFKSEKISEADWKEFFKGYEEEDSIGGLMENGFNNVKMDVELKEIVKNETYEIVSELKGTLVYADKKEYVQLKMKSTITGELPEYMVDDYQTGEAEFEYYLIYSDVWYEAEKVIFIKGEETLVSTGAFLAQLFGVDRINNFSTFKYDESKKGYYRGEEYEDEDEDFGGRSALLKFKDKKLKTVYTKAIDTVDVADESERYTYYVFTYGGQSVTLPEANS